MTKIYKWTSWDVKLNQKEIEKEVNKLKKEKNPKKVIENLKNELLEKWKKKTWLLFYKYVQVWVKK